MQTELYLLKGSYEITWLIMVIIGKLLIDPVL